ncbi:MAG: proton-conducting transporter membrane subunit [Polyangiaceae bacterium]
MSSDLGRHARKVTRITGFGALTAAMLPGLLVHERLTAAQHTFALPELMHVTYNNPGATLLGVALVKGLWLALFIPFMLLAAVAPLHTWLVDVVDDASASVSALIAGCAVEVGIYGMLRFNYGILPEATRWAAGGIVGLGAATIVYGALCAFAQTDLKKFVAYASVSHAGIALLGVGSLTPEGVAGACVEMSSHAISIAALVLAVGAIEDRAKTRSIDALAGVGREMPLLGTALVLSLAASFGVPGLIGFWGECLSAIGTYPGYRLAVTIAAGGFALVAAGHVRVLDKIAFGKIDEAWQKSPYLEPFGGRFPDLGSRELGAIGPLVVLVVLLGLWPAPLLTTISGAVRDTSALVNPPGPDQIALR